MIPYLAIGLLCALLQSLTLRCIPYAPLLIVVAWPVWVAHTVWEALQDVRYWP